MKGRQEDAEEFLLIFLDLLDKELTTISKSFETIEQDMDELNEVEPEGEWTEVDRKQKPMNIHTVKNQYDFFVFNLIVYRLRPINRP